MAAIEPMSQFLVHKVVPLPPVEVGGVSLDLSITNSVLFLLVAAGAVALFFLSAARGQLVPGRLQSAAESLYDLVDGGLTGGIIGDKGRPFLPYVMTLFSLIAVINMIGLIPTSFTPTSQLAVTATLAVMTFLIVVIVGVIRNGFGVYKLFVPPGLHWSMAIFLFPIELLSFLVRPVTLALRLFGNMMAGHVMVYLFATFVAALGAFALQGGMASLGFLGSGVSMTMLVAIMGLEIVVALIQAFVFSALTCVYINEVVNLGHGH
jgi:F-type H+-transporting ATPase subunit a